MIAANLEIVNPADTDDLHVRVNGADYRLTNSHRGVQAAPADPDGRPTAAPVMFRGEDDARAAIFVLLAQAA